MLYTVQPCAHALDRATAPDEQGGAFQSRGNCVPGSLSLSLWFTATTLNTHDDYQWTRFVSEQEGTEGTSFYIVSSGALEVLRSDQGFIRSLTVGDYFVSVLRLRIVCLRSVRSTQLTSFLCYWCHRANWHWCPMPRVLPPFVARRKPC